MRTALTGLALAATFALGATGAAQSQGEAYVTIESPSSVPDTMAALRQAVEGAGATIFAEVDHAAGAASAAMDLAPARLLIFGNPKLGTPAMQDDIRAGLLLPLRALVYEGEDGGTRIAYQDPASMFADLTIPPDAAYVATMQGALAKLTGAAAAQ